MVKIKNTLSTPVDLLIIREIVTTLQAGEEQDVPLDSNERIEIKETPP